jgi:hypothetical protein
VRQQVWQFSGVAFSGTAFSGMVQEHRSRPWPGPMPPRSRIDQIDPVFVGVPVGGLNLVVLFRPADAPHCGFPGLFCW